MAPLAPPQGGLSDDQLLAAPGPTDDRLLAAPGPRDDVLLAAPGPRDDVLLAAPGPAASTAQPGLASRLVGIGERGMVGGALGIAGAAQSAGRWLDNHTQGILPGLATPSADNVDLQAIGDRVLDADHAYKPQEATGKILQGAISGVTGAALTGGAGLLPLAAGTAAGVAAPAARALGASDDTANDIALGVGMLPFGGAAAAAGARAATGAVRDGLVGRAAARMTDDQAVNTVLMDNAVRQYADLGTGNNRLAQQVAGYKKNLGNAVGDYAASAKQAGLIDAAGARDIGNAGSQAQAGTNGLTNAPGSALPTVRALGLPDAHQQALEGALGQLDASSGQQFGRSTAGPVTAAVQTLAPVAGYGSALGALLHGDPAAAAGIAGGVAIGAHATPLLTRIGQIGDRILGTDQPQFAWNADAARRAVADRGLTVPSQNPLSALQDATSANNQLISDRAAAAAAQDAADKQYLYDYADAQHMNRQFDLSANQQRAYEVADANAMDRQITQQQNFQRAQEVGDATAMDRQRTQQQNFERAQQVGDANAMDRQITQQQNFERAQQVGDAQAIDRQRTAGQNAADGAGNWMERALLSKFKRNNPGVPVTGAAAVGSNSPQGLFEATGGKYGSPVDPADPMANGPATAPSGAPSAAPQAPVTAPQVPAGGPQTAPAAPPAVGPFNPNVAPTGGAALANMMLKDQTGRTVPTEQLHLSANKVLDPQAAFEFTSGVNVHPDVAYRVAQHAAAQIPAQATSEVSSLMGAQSLLPSGAGASGVLPNGGDRGPIQNLPRWQGAAASRQAHAQQMMTLAPTPEEKQAISQIAATPRTADKQAILDAYSAANPGADLRRFTPQLMQGVS